MGDQRARGEWGERVAARHLSRRGWRILARRWRWSGGELDLVIRRGRTVAAVEVKVRRDPVEGIPAVCPGQRRRLADGIVAYMAAHPGGEAPDWRIDLVVVDDGDGRVRVDHRPGLLNPD